MSGNEGSGILEELREVARRLPVGDPVRTLVERAASIDEIRGAAPILIRLLAHQSNGPAQEGSNGVRGR